MRRNVLSISRIFLILLILFVFSGLLSSCSQVKRLAKQYIEKNDTITVMILTPDTVYKKNSRFERGRLNISPYDEAAISQTKTLKSVNDTAIYDLIMQSIIDELKKYPFKIFESVTSKDFLKQEKETYVLNIVQVEIHEYDTPVKESQQYDTITYYEEFLLNTVSVNLWMEVSVMNDTSSTPQLLFYSACVNDVIDGRFRKALFSNDVNFVYSRYNITQDDVYNLASWFGKKNASNIFDYFMNMFIYRLYKGESSGYKYLTWDKENMKIFPAKENRFTFMKRD